MASTSTVSVVMPTFNRLASLRRALEGLAQQTGLEQPIETVVVSDGSTDGTDRFLASVDVPLPLVALSQENAGPAAARNRGIAAASGELVLFLDDDVVPIPGLVAAHVRDHAEADDLVVIGPMNTPRDHDISPWIQWEQNMLYKQYEAMARGLYGATARQFYTGNASVARRHVIAAGGFDPSFRRAEDVELAYRLADRGLRFAFDHDAVVLHYAARSFDAWRRAAADYGHNDVVFARDHGRGWLLDSIAEEFGDRNALIRGMTRTCVPHPRLATGASAALSAVARGAGRIGADAVAQRALSALYNLEYYRGMADELGDPRRLLERFDEAAAA